MCRVYTAERQSQAQHTQVSGETKPRKVIQVDGSVHYRRGGNAPDDEPPTVVERHISVSKRTTVRLGTDRATVAIIHGHRLSHIHTQCMTQCMHMRAEQCGVGPATTRARRISDGGGGAGRLPAGGCDVRGARRAGTAHGSPAAAERGGGGWGGGGRPGGGIARVDFALLQPSNPR